MSAYYSISNNDQIAVTNITKETQNSIQLLNTKGDCCCFKLIRVNNKCYNNLCIYFSREFHSIICEDIYA